MPYHDNSMVPRDVCFVDGDSISVGSLTAASLTYSEDEVVLSPPKRWNCDAGLEPKTRQRNHNVFKPPAVLPVSHGPFRDPEFFPPFASMKSQLTAVESCDDDDEAENDSDAKRRFTCNVFGSNRISTHARMEMFRHQISKPFRVLPFPSAPRIDTSCMGKSILQSVANQVQNTSALDCNKSRKLVRQGPKENGCEPDKIFRFGISNHEGYPSDEEMDRREPIQSTKDTPLGGKLDRLNTTSPLSNQSFDFSMDKAELSLSNDTHWLSLVATDESSVEECGVELKLELD
ncbi:unnamed protein product [Cylindrotheca closterium]|uniref:Uncharacterized protein n=1 Tax=Cylindrotheca closterium TaxID=2856 RepID=A0AAD2GD78_9STRA|nr:unnamed protein product [Cylindrotheca closterium]